MKLKHHNPLQCVVKQAMLCNYLITLSLGIGRVFALKPRVIISDESMASLDSIIKNGIFQFLTYDKNHRLGFMCNKDEFTKVLYTNFQFFDLKASNI